MLDATHAHFAAGGEPRFAASCNLALPAAAFRALGGFDPSFLHAEDRDSATAGAPPGGGWCGRPAPRSSTGAGWDSGVSCDQQTGYGRGAYALHRRIAGGGIVPTPQPAFYRVARRAGAPRSPPAPATGRTGSREPARGSGRVTGSRRRPRDTASAGANAWRRRSPCPCRAREHRRCRAVGDPGPGPDAHGRRDDRRAAPDRRATCRSSWSLVGIDGRAPEPPEASSDFAAVRLVYLGGALAPRPRGSPARERQPRPTWPLPRRTASRSRAGRTAWSRASARGGRAWGRLSSPANPARRAVALTVFDYGRWMGGPPGRLAGPPRAQLGVPARSAARRARAVPGGVGGGDPHARGHARGRRRALPRPRDPRPPHQHGALRRLRGGVGRILTRVRGAEGGEVGIRAARALCGRIAGPAVDPLPALRRQRAACRVPPSAAQRHRHPGRRAHRVCRRGVPWVTRRVGATPRAP